jgi:hypothetical protein
MATSKQAASNKKQFDSAGSRGTSPDPSDGISGPGFGVKDGLLLSRSGRSAPGGKFDDELSRIPLHSETKAVVNAIAASHGMSLTEFVRTLVECVAWGSDAMANSNADRIRRVGALLGGNPPQGGR